jgi:type IV secretion system protein TrbJ
MRKNIWAVIVAAAVAIGSTALVPKPAVAGGSGGGATEVTQLLNNGQLLLQVVQATATTAKLYQQYATQLEQFNVQKLMQKSLEGAFPTAAIKASLDEVKKIKDARDSLMKLRGSLTQIETKMNERFQEASLGGLSWEKYVENEGRLLREQNKRAILRMKEEQSVMAEVEKDHQLVQQFASKISGTSGVHQSVALLNTQMNRLIQTQSRVSEIMAKSVGTDVAVKEAQEASKRTNDGKLRDQWNRKNIVERVSLEGAFDNFDASNGPGLTSESPSR